MSRGREKELESTPPAPTAGPAEPGVLANELAGWYGSIRVPAGSRPHTQTGPFEEHSIKRFFSKVRASCRKGLQEPGPTATVCSTAKPNGAGEVTRKGLSGEAAWEYLRPQLRDAARQWQPHRGH